MVAGDFDMRDAIGAAPFLYFIFFILFSGSGWWSLGLLIYEMLVGLPSFFCFLFFILFFRQWTGGRWGF